MNTKPGSNQPADATLCPKCKKTTVAHNGGQWCPTCGAFATPPDLRDTAHIQSEQPPLRSPFLMLREEEAERAALPRCCKCLQPIDDLGSAVYDDDEWLCGYCIASYDHAAHDR